MCQGFVGCMDISNDQDGHSCCSPGVLSLVRIAARKRQVLLTLI